MSNNTKIKYLFKFLEFFKKIKLIVLITNNKNKFKYLFKKIILYYTLIILFVPLVLQFAPMILDLIKKYFDYDNNSYFNKFYLNMNLHRIY